MFEQIFVNALIAGSTYSLIGMGFGLIFSTARFFHMAHGGVITVAGYVTYAMVTEFHLNQTLSIFITILAAATLGGAMEIAIFRQIRRSNGGSTIQLIASLGILIVLQNLISIIFGDDVRVLNAGVASESIQIWAARITDIQIKIIFINIIVWLLISLVLQRTQIGRMVRVVTDDAELSRIFGISVDMVILLTFITGSVLAGIAGILLAYDIGLTPLLGYHALFMGVVAAIAGGMTSPTGTMLAGLTLGLILQISGWFFLTQWQDAIAFTILILFLLLRPQGFFGKPLRSAKV
jgi:branched-chain amino acid transport system permease protein